MSEKSKLELVWNEFISQWTELANKEGFPEIDTDPNWPSPCEFEQGDKQFWQPQPINETLSFSNVEEAIGYELNEEYKTFFCLYFADNISATHQDGVLQYLQAWSKPDFERLQQNLIGHLMMKARLKKSPTLFFAVTDEEDLNIVIDNIRGNIALEYVGKEPHKVLASSLAEFISQTTPSLKPLI